MVDLIIKFEKWEVMSATDCVILSSNSTTFANLSDRFLSHDEALYTSRLYEVSYYTYTNHGVYMTASTCVHVFSTSTLATINSKEGTRKQILCIEYYKNIH